MQKDFSKTCPPKRAPLLLTLVCGALLVLVSAGSGAHRTAHAAIAPPPAHAVPIDDWDVRLSIASPPGASREAVTVEACTQSAASSDWTVVALEERYASALQRFYSELDRASARRLDKGDFWIFVVGDDSPGRLSEGNISVVSPAGQDTYKLVVFDRSNAPDLYRLMAEANRLREALAVRAGVQDRTAEENS